MMQGKKITIESILKEILVQYNAAKLNQKGNWLPKNTLLLVNELVKLEVGTTIYRYRALKRLSLAIKTCLKFKEYKVAVYVEQVRENLYPESRLFTSRYQQRTECKLWILRALLREIRGQDSLSRQGDLLFENNQSLVGVCELMSTLGKSLGKEWTRQISRGFYSAIKICNRGGDYRSSRKIVELQERYNHEVLEAGSTSDSPICQSVPTLPDPIQDTAPQSNDSSIQSHNAKLEGAKVQKCFLQPMKAGEKLTQSQERVFETLCHLYRITQSKDFEPPLRASSSKLIVGPTGVGKSVLVRHLAQHFDCNYHSFTVGTWVPLGATKEAGKPTLVLILEASLNGKPTIIHIDELDKFYTAGNDASWLNACKDNVMNLLDRSLNLEVLQSSRAVTNIEGFDIHKIREMLMTKTLFIGSGTWQNLYRNAVRNNHCGFGQASVEAPRFDRETLRASGEIPEEILRRFNREVEFLTYPDLNETKEILNYTGLQELADKYNYPFKADDIDWDRDGGLSFLDSLRMNILLWNEKQETEWYKNLVF